MAGLEFDTCDMGPLNDFFVEVFPGHIATSERKSDEENLRNKLVSGAWEECYF